MAVVERWPLWRKWPLWGGGRCGDVANVESWPLVEKWPLVGRWPLWRGGCHGEVALSREKWP